MNNPKPASNDYEEEEEADASSVDARSYVTNVSSADAGNEKQQEKKKTKKKNAETTDDDEDDNKSGKKKIPPAPLGKVLGLARPEFGVLGLAVLLMIAAEGAGLVIPLLVANAYDDLIDPDSSIGPKQRFSKIETTMIYVFILNFGGTGLGFLRSSIMGIAGQRVVCRTRNRLYGAILRQEIGFFDRHKTGELVSRLGSDTQLLQEGTSQAIPEVTVGLIKIIISITIMFSISAKLAGVMIACVTTIVALCIPCGKILGTLSKKFQDVLGTAQTHSTEALGAMRTVQSFAAEQKELDKYSAVIGQPANYKFWFPTDYKRNVTTYSIGFFKAMTQTGFYTIVFGFGFGALYIVLYYGFYLVIQEELSLGQLTAFQSYVFQIGGSLGGTSQFISKLIEAQGAASRIFYLLERKPQIPTTDDFDDNSKSKASTADVETPSSIVVAPQKPKECVGVLDLNNITFAYPSRSNVNVLRNVSLHIPANTTTALVGASGSGKSTIVSLVQRFYDVTGGSVTLDGIDIRHLDLNWLRSNIAYVQQEPQLFGVTVRENIIYGMGGNDNVTQQEVETAAIEANAHDFISQWPDGYNTLCGERGIRLSGGEKQRICIARALLVNPRILLLDEATSALDAESEHLVQEAISKAVIGRTVLIVAHRLSTIQKAQQIVVVDDHQIVDFGTHEDLLLRCVKYQDLIKRQSLAGKTTELNGHYKPEEVNA